MSARWQQLQREDGSEQADRDDEESEEDVEDGDQDTTENEEEPQEHRIGIPSESSEDTFWNDDDADEEATRPEREEDHALLDVLAAELRRREVPSYLDQFEVAIPDAELVVGSVPLADVQQREREIEEAQLRRQQLELDLFRQREQRLAHKELEAREKLKHEAVRQREQLIKHRLQAAQALALQSRRLSTVFHQAEAHLTRVLSQQHARIREVFGVPEVSPLPAERRRFKAETQRVPIALQVRVKTLRAVKDKLPRGHYVLLTTLYDRLGGHALRWTAWEERPRMPHLTQPFYHSGRFYVSELPVHQDMVVVCPSIETLRPSNVLVFELFKLGKKMKHSTLGDEIVAWGALPLLTPELVTLDGKYKLPLLRGEMDATMDKFADVEAAYTRDLTAWLCNLYVQVTPMREQVERLIRGGPGAEHVDTFDVEIDQRNATLRVGMRKRGRRMETEASSFTASSSATKLVDSDMTEVKGAKRDGFLARWRRHRSRQRKKKKSDAKVYAGDVVMPQLIEDEEEKENEDDLKRPSVHRIDHERPVVPALPPIPADVSEDPEASQADSPSVTRVDLENYQFSVNASVARESAQHVRFQTQRKLHFLRHELFVDLGIWDVWKLEFWLVVVLLAGALWLRVYVHYVTQWMFLKAQRVPVFELRMFWTRCLLKYPWRTVTTSTELGVIVLGVLGNWVLFGVLVLAALAAQSWVGELPAFASRFLVCVALATVVDPFLVLAVDVVNRQYGCSTRVGCVSSTGLSLLGSPECTCAEGDAFKLYTRFLHQEGSGLVGILLTIVVYVSLTWLALVTVYFYLLHVHMNGRMLDVYRRLHAQESDLFVPHDCEVSFQELHAICDRAMRWKGHQGRQRKVFVHDYVLQDPLDPSFQEKTTHVAIYTVGLQETPDAAVPRELYRHFLKSNDGAILELLGDVGDADDDDTTASHTWQHVVTPRTIGSMALLYNILQDHPRTAPLEDENHERQAEAL